MPIFISIPLALEARFQQCGTGRNLTDAMSAGPTQMTGRGLANLPWQRFASAHNKYNAIVITPAAVLLLLLLALLLLLLLLLLGHGT